MDDARNDGIDIDRLTRSPFFVLKGPEGARLACQWTSFHLGHARTREFEILPTDRPEAMGTLFGLFDGGRGEFRMRPEIVRDTCEAVENGCQDLEWRGTMDDLLEAGHDWEEGPDGNLLIPDQDPVDESTDDRDEMRSAA